MKGLGLLAIAAAIWAVGVGTAMADTAGTVTVLGPADASDSSLMESVIEPDFELAFPQFEVTYTGSAQKTAMSNAETGGASVLFLHEPKLEAEFVAAGYSSENRFGSALFSGSYGLAGDNGDPAKVAATAPHDLAAAFAAVAKAGAGGNAVFLSRGGTSTASGNTVAEHAIWKLVQANGLTPAGVELCEVSAIDGGGWSPIAPGTPESHAPECPDSGTVNSPHLPAWYRVESGSNQAALLTDVNSCAGGSVDCYALTDLGTFNLLAKLTQIPGASILSAGQSASAPGGQTVALTRFHGFVVNPAKVSGVNLAGAQAFISFVTSPAEQAQIGAYLKSAPRSPGPAFVPDAAPLISATPSTSTGVAGSAVTVGGAVADPEPGAPGLAGQSVVVRAVGGVPIASGLIDVTGHYSVTFVPPASGSYEVATAPISRLLDATAVPPFGDVLAASASAPFGLTVTTAPGGPPSGSTTKHHEAIRIGKVRVKRGTVSIAAVLSAPAAKGAKLSMLVERLAAKGSHHGKHAAAAKAKAKHRATFKSVASTSIATGKKAATIAHKLAPGSYLVKLTYSAPGAGKVESSPKRVKVPAP
jgi:tungstate transport system substrate-binding protein